MELTRFALGRVPMLHETAMSSKQSMMGGGQVYFPCGDAELCDIGQPLHVWFILMKIPLDDVLHGRADLAPIRIVSWEYTIIIVHHKHL